MHNSKEEAKRNERNMPDLRFGERAMCFETIAKESQKILVYIERKNSTKITQSSGIDERKLTSKIPKD